MKEKIRDLIIFTFLLTIFTIFFFTLFQILNIFMAVENGKNLSTAIKDNELEFQELFNRLLQ